MSNHSNKSFILHIDSLVIFDKMTNEQAGIFIKAIYHYQLYGEIPDLEFGLQMAITPFINQFIRDQQKYNSIVERNKNNGLKGGRPKTQKNPKNPVGNLGTQKNPEEPNKTLNDSNNDNDNKNNNVSKNNNENTNIDLFQPSIDDVEPDIKGVDVWSAYSEGYKFKYGVLPVRNAKVNKQCQDLVKRLGRDAINVVKFYLTSTDRFYLQKTHDLGLCLASAETLHTQWQRNHHVTASDIKQHQVDTATDKLRQSLGNGSFSKKLAEEKANNPLSILKTVRDHFTEERSKNVK